MLRPESEWWTARHQQLTERNRQSFVRLEQELETVWHGIKHWKR